MPPLFVLGPEGRAELVNYRTRQNYYIVDRLFAAAELRLGGDKQQKVRIVRTDGRFSVSDNPTDARDDDARHETAAGFRLRPERPRVMRLSRKVLAGLCRQSRVSRSWARSSGRSAQYAQPAKRPGTLQHRQQDTVGRSCVFAEGLHGFTTERPAAWPAAAG